MPLMKKDRLLMKAGY